MHFTVRGRNEVNASYIRSQTRGDLNNLSSVLVPFAQPVIRPNVYGILPSDVPNRVMPTFLPLSSSATMVRIRKLIHQKTMR